MFVAGEAPVAPRTAGSATSPVVAARKEDRGREKEQRSRGKGGCCRTSRTRAAAGQGSVEGGARADRVESGGRWGSEGRRWVAVPKGPVAAEKFVNLIDVQYASLFILPSIRISFEFHLLSFIFFFIFILQAC